jgi:hypothetical protein
LAQRFWTRELIRYEAEAAAREREAIARGDLPNQCPQRGKVMQEIQGGTPHDASCCHAATQASASPDG